MVLSGSRSKRGSRFLCIKETDEQGLVLKRAPRGGEDEEPGQGAQPGPSSEQTVGTETGRAALVSRSLSNCL